MEENLQQLEATYGAPASLIERSAAARAKATGSTTEAVVAMWAGEKEAPVEDAAAPAAETDTPVPPPQGEVAAPPGADGAGRSLSGPELLAAVAEARGMPASLIERSAKARAGATGGSVEDVLLEWAAEEGLGVSVPAAEPNAPIPPPQREAVAPSDADGGDLAPAPSGSGLSGAALLAAVAEARGMSASLIERSASARAKTAGVEIDAVLRDWAEEEGLDVSAPADESPSSVSPAEGRGDAVERSDDEGGSAPSGALSGAALLSAVAVARKMPESLVERSAKARAKQTGGTSEEVLLEWAVEEGVDVTAADGPAPIPPLQGEVAAPPSADGGGLSLSGPALLSAVAVARKMPESLVERSAKARAKKEGGTVDDVLLEWAAEEGLEVSPVASPQSPVGEPEVLEEASDALAADAGPPAKAVIPSPPEPEPVEEPEPEEPASPRTRYPAWLAAVLVVIPLLAVLYLVVVPNQPTCGSAGQLAIDPATGIAVGCNGGEYGVDDVSNFSIGAAVYEAACAVCHGADGGGGAGPAMAGGAVLEAFPASSCSTQIEWIALGSADWPDATYGANNTPVAGGMPGFEGQLTELEIAQVTLYERVEFGGLEVGATETECGFEVEEG